MIVRFILWGVAFIVPAISLGVPLPHTLYLLVPVLVAVDGLHSGGARRIVIWISLSLLYEMTYQMPLGVFALSIGAVGAIHVGLAQLFRIDTRVKEGSWRPIHLARSMVVASLWMTGLIIGSAWLAVLIGPAAVFTWHSLWGVWVARGAAFGAIGILAIILGVLFWERISRFDVIFSDHAIIQTTNISD